MKTTVIYTRKEKSSKMYSLDIFFVKYLNGY